MRLFETIEARRSIFPKQYNDRPIKNEDIKLILKAANFAPTQKKLNHGDLKFYKMIIKMSLVSSCLKNIKIQLQNSLNLNLKV